jgi:hypothetical protein
LLDNFPTKNGEEIIMLVKPTQGFWAQHVERWKTSSLSQAQYCKKHQLNAHSLSYHKRKLETQHALVKGTGFIQVPVPPWVPPATLTLHFASGLSLSGIESNNIDVVKQLTAVLS